MVKLLPPRPTFHLDATDHERALMGAHSAVRAGMLGAVESAGAGGVPVIVQGQCAGAVGISGAAPDIDDAIALAAMARLDSMRPESRPSNKE